jgi:hypothetical protein
MIARALRRLPGVQFESRTPGLADVLPRMDVAVFTGFASKGPLHAPVAIDDPRTFADVFGGDAPLAWDRDRGQLLNANLGPAVRSFFRNGGNRCWVIRVARTLAIGNDRARANRFPVPGLVRLSQGVLRPAFVAARSEGSWSDRLGVAGAVQLQPLLAEAAVFEAGVAVSVEIAPPDGVVVGDVLRLTWPSGFSLMAPIVGLENNLATLGADQVWLPAAPPAPSADPWGAFFFPAGESPEWLSLVLGEPAFASDGTVSLTLAASVDEGQFVLLTRGEDQVWVRIDGTRAVGGNTQLTGFWSAPSFTAPAAVLADPAAAITAERVRAELWVSQDGGHPQRMGDLGLAPGQPNFLGALPSDSRLFQSSEDLLSAEEQALRDRVRALAGDGIELRDYHANLWQSVANPRFPLSVDLGLTNVFLPFGLPIVPVDFLDAAPVPGDPLERDGLANFAADLFLDPDLAEETTADLSAQADFIRWQQPSPRRLQGIHAALEIDEATIISVPDASQRGWSRETVIGPQELDTPVLTATADAASAWRLTWTDVDPAAFYALESATKADFSNAQAATLALRTAYDVPADVPSGTWYRVRAWLPAATSTYFESNEAAGSFWSDPAQILIPPPQFHDCPPGQLIAPVLTLAAPPDVNGSFRLQWTAVASALSYEVQESTGLDFDDAATVFSGNALAASLYGRAPGRYHYRARALNGPFSNGLSVTVQPPSRRVANPAKAFNEGPLLAVHAALLRLCASRGDLLAVLSLPSHFRETDAASYPNDLRALTPEELPWSYGALYHPWLTVESDAGLVNAPADGCICGVMAARAIRRGAWIAPANEPLTDVLGLTPPVSRDQRQRLFDAQVNLVRQEPQGFVVLSSDTLAQDPDLVPINVRRLLSLLRRAALQLGPSFVFEPNSDIFRRTVQGEFVGLLSKMFRGGAFAGATAGEAFQVVVDSSVNPPESLDLGRFVIELRIAPALPLQFLTVRLVQSGGTQTAEGN